MPDNDDLRQLAQEVRDLPGQVADLIGQVVGVAQQLRALEPPRPPARKRTGLWDVMRLAAGVLGAVAAAGVVWAVWQLSGLTGQVQAHTDRIAGVEAELRQTPRLHVGRVVDVNPSRLLVESGGEQVPFAPFGDVPVGIDGKAAGLGDLKPGESVEVYTDGDGRVLTVEARSE